jgi:signal peptidase
MIKKIAKHHITKKTTKTLRVFLMLLLFTVLPVVVVTFLSMKGVTGNLQSFIVLTGSMQPVLKPGSVVYTERQQFYREGDVISFKNAQGETITHRIVSVDKKNDVISYKTKGDANSVGDKTTVPVSNVIGSVRFSLPFIGFAVNYIRTLPGLIGLIIVPGLFFVGYELHTIKREIEKQAEKRLLAKLEQTA